MDDAIRVRQETIRRFVAGRRARPLFQVEPPAPRPGEVPADLDLPTGRIRNDARLQVRRQLWDNERWLALDGGDDWVPALHPYLSTGALASAFGAEVLLPDDEIPPMTRPILFRPEDALALAPPKTDAGLLGEVLRRTRLMREEGGRDYPIRTTDIQSPLDTAMLLWDQTDLFLSMRLAPRAVHHVCDLVTDLTIEFVRRQRDAAGEAFVPLHWPRTWWPAGEGLGVSDDVLPLIGPADYEEFGLPYLARLSEAFGGIMVHSCGNFSQSAAALGRLPGLRMVNFGATEQPVENLEPHVGPDVILSTHFGLNKAICLGSQAEFVEHVFARARDRRRLWILAGTDGDDLARRTALIARLRELGAGAPPK